MSQQAEGSKAMTIYIVVCFVLAAGALLAYKVMNDKRTELAAEYRARYQNVVDIQAALAPSINDYYRKVKSGEIRTVNKAVKDSTQTALREVAEKLAINEDGDVKLDRLDFEAEKNQEKKAFGYIEYGLTVTLKNVTQDDWAKFLRNVLDPFSQENVLDDYISVATIDATRVVSDYKKMVASEQRADKSYADDSLWKVTIKFVWFATLDEAGRA